MVIVCSRHLLPWLSSTGPSHSQHRRKLSLVVSGQGGRAGRPGKHRLLLSSTAGPFAGLNFQPETRKKGRGWDVEPRRVKTQYSRGIGGRESRAGCFALVVANKHINSKVDNQVGSCGGWRGDRGAASGVKRAVQREQSWPVQSLSRGGGGGDSHRSEALPRSLEFQPLLACSTIFDFVSCG